MWTPEEATDDYICERCGAMARLVVDDQGYKVCEECFEDQREAVLGARCTHKERRM